MSKRLFTHLLGISLSLSVIALCLLAPVLFNRRPPAANTDNFQLPSTPRAIVIDPARQAVTLEAIDGN